MNDAILREVVADSINEYVDSAGRLPDPEKEVFIIKFDASLRAVGEGRAKPTGSARCMPYDEFRASLTPSTRAKIPPMRERALATGYLMAAATSADGVGIYVDLFEGRVQGAEPRAVAPGAGRGKNE